MLRSLLPGWLRGPLDVGVSFDDRPYKLGERIDLGIELTSRKDVEVAEGRVELVCEERWAETWVRPDPMGRTPGMLRRGREIPGPQAPKREVKEYRNTFVHSAATFGGDFVVRRDLSVKHRVRLDVDTVWPPHAKGGTLAWTLVATVVTPDGREVTGARKVTVAVP